MLLSLLSLFPALLSLTITYASGTQATARWESIFHLVFHKLNTVPAGWYAQICVFFAGLCYLIQFPDKVPALWPALVERVCCIVLPTETLFNGPPGAFAHEVPDLVLAHGGQLTRMAGLLIWIGPWGMFMNLGAVRLMA